MSDLIPAAIGADEARERLARVKVNISAAGDVPERAA